MSKFSVDIPSGDLQDTSTEVPNYTTPATEVVVFYSSDSPQEKAENFLGLALKTAAKAAGVGWTDFSTLTSHKGFSWGFFCLSSLPQRCRRMLSANEKLCNQKERSHIPFTILITKAEITSPG